MQKSAREILVALYPKCHLSEFNVTLFGATYYVTRYSRYMLQVPVVLTWIGINTGSPDSTCGAVNCSHVWHVVGVILADSKTRTTDSREDGESRPTM